MAEDLSGRVALVTGATSGLGRVIAEELARAGALVIVHGRSQEAVDEAVGSLLAEGRLAAGIVGDLRDPSAPARIVNESTQAHGPIDLLVNNAADQRLTPVADDAGATWREILEVNLVAVVELTRQVCLGAEDCSAVSIVNVGSVEGGAPFPGHSAYAASKAALASFTASAAHDWHPARVNAVAPGLIEREGIAQAWPDGHFWWRQTAPAGRTVSAREVARAVVFLGSSAASGITGVTLPVDGGWSSAARAPWGRPQE